MVSILRASLNKKLPEAINSSQSIKNDDGKNVLAGRLLALDLGEKRVGVAISDELCITIRPLPPIRRTNWKQLLRAVSDTIASFDARALVIGLPLRLDGTEGTAAQETRRIARNFKLSLGIPVYLQDERLTSHAAEEGLREAGHPPDDLRSRVDSESAAIILRDFIAGDRRAKPPSSR